MTTPIVLLPGLDGTGRLFERFTAACPSHFDPRRIAFPSEAALGYAELVEHVLGDIPKDDG